MENFAQLIQRLLELQSGGRQRSPELIAEDDRLIDGLQKRTLAGRPRQTLTLPAAQEDPVANALAEDNEHTAACALCWNEDCGSLVISYRTAGERGSDLWDFVCLRCGLAFSVPEGELAKERWRDA